MTIDRLPVLVFLVLGLAFDTGAVFGQAIESVKGVALVVGNSRYAHISPSLPNPVNDATDMEATLKTLGWDVIVVTNGELKAFRGAVQEFGRKLAGRKAGLFYYAGHGIQDSGENYLLPVDADITTNADLPVSTITANYVLAVMDDAAVPVKIMVLDACRDNPFAERTQPKTRGVLPVGGLAAIQTAVKGTILVYATAPNAKSLDGEKGSRNGVFTEAFLANLKTPGTDFQEIFDRTAQAVSFKTGGQQNPWLNKSYYGKLYFVSPDEAQALADVRLKSLKAEQDKLIAEMASRNQAIAGAKSATEKQRLELEQKTAQAMATAQKEEQAVLERTKVLAEARAAEEAKNRAASVQRAADAETQLASLRRQVEDQRRVEDSVTETEDPRTAIERLKAIEAGIASIQHQFSDALARRVESSTEAWKVRTGAIEAYQKEPWENQRELGERKDQAVALATRDRDNEVAGLRDNFSQAATRETSPLTRQRSELRQKIMAKEWVVPSSNLTLKIGAFDTETKVWPLTVTLDQPPFFQRQELFHRLVYTTPAELKQAFQESDLAIKAGSYVVRAGYTVSESAQAGFWKATLSRLEVVDLTRPINPVVRGKTGIDLGWVGTNPDELAQRRHDLDVQKTSLQNKLIVAKRTRSSWEFAGATGWITVGLGLAAAAGGYYIGLSARSSYDVALTSAAALAARSRTDQAKVLFQGGVVGAAVGLLAGLGSLVLAPDPKDVEKDLEGVQYRIQTLGATE